MITFLLDVQNTKFQWISPREPMGVWCNDLRFALDVIEERSHLGLDPQYVAKLRSVVERRAPDEAERRAATPIPQGRHERVD